MPDSAARIREEIVVLRKQLLENPGEALIIVSSSARNSSILFPALNGFVEYEDSIPVVILVGKLVLSYPSAVRWVVFGNN